MPKGKNISDADRRLVTKMLVNEGGRTISNADRRLAGKMLAKEGGRTISDADRRLLEEKYLNRNDGGIASKTRTF
jgi:hypothetical protein